MGTAVLGMVKDDYEVKSRGGVGEVGGKWEPLSLATLLLRHKVTTKSSRRRLYKVYRALPAEQRGMFRTAFQRLRAAYRGQERSAVRKALKILEKKRRAGTVSVTRYKRLKRELELVTPKQVRKLAFAGAFAEILRDTGRLMNSFSPGLAKAGDQILEAVPGKVTVGTNVTYFKYHQSKDPRKQKADGSGPILPRRQVLPDDGEPLPDSWWGAMTNALADGMMTRAFWVSYLGPQAA